MVVLHGQFSVDCYNTLSDQVIKTEILFVQDIINQHFIYLLLWWNEEIVSATYIFVSSTALNVMYYTFEGLNICCHFLWCHQPQKVLKQNSREVIYHQKV